MPESISRATLLRYIKCLGFQASAPRAVLELKVLAALLRCSGVNSGSHSAIASSAMGSMGKVGPQTCCHSCMASSTACCGETAWASEAPRHSLDHLWAAPAPFSQALVAQALQALSA
eukprot:9979663-Heterocapsa_arctica.AAC.1